MSAFPVAQGFGSISQCSAIEESLGKFLQRFSFTLVCLSHSPSWGLRSYTKEIENMYTIEHLLIDVASCLEVSQNSFQLTWWREILVWSKICFFIVSFGQTETNFIPFHICCSCPLYSYLKVTSSSTLCRIKTENITSVFIHKICDKLKLYPCSY